MIGFVAMTDVRLSSCLLMDDNKILLVKSKDSDCWSLPGGPIDEKAGDAQSALNHAENIAGLKARVIQLFGVYGYQKECENSEEHVFESDLHEGTDTTLTAKEGFEAKWFSISTVKKESLCQELLSVLDDM